MAGGSISAAGPKVGADLVVLGVATGTAVVLVVAVAAGAEAELGGGGAGATKGFVRSTLAAVVAASSYALSCRCNFAIFFSSLVYAIYFSLVRSSAASSSSERWDRAASSSGHQRYPFSARSRLRSSRLKTQRTFDTLLHALRIRAQSRSLPGLP